MTADSSLDTEALWRARDLLRKRKPKSGVLPALAAAGFAAASAMVLAVVVIMTPLSAQSRDSLLNPPTEAER